MEQMEETSLNKLSQQLQVSALFQNDTIIFLN